MKKLLSLLSVLTISGTAVPTTIAASSYEKQHQLNSYIIYSQTNNLENLRRKKRENNENITINNTIGILKKIDLNNKTIGGNEVNFLFTFNDKLYYDNEGRIHEYDKKTNNNKIIFKPYSRVYSGLYLKNKLYFPALNGKVYEYDLKTKNNEVVMEKNDIFSQCFVFKNKLYFATLGNKVYEYNPETKENKIIIQAYSNITYGAILNNKLYFNTDDKVVYEYNPNNLQQKILDVNNVLNNNLNTYAFLNNKLYFKSNNGKKIYEYDSVKKQNKIIINSDEEINFLSILDNKLYFKSNSDKLYEYDLVIKKTRFINTEINNISFIFILNDKLCFITNNNIYNVYEFEPLGENNYDIINLKEQIRSGLYIHYKKQNPDIYIKDIKFNMDNLIYSDIKLIKKEEISNYSIPQNICEGTATFSNEGSDQEEYQTHSLKYTKQNNISFEITKGLNKRTDNMLEKGNSSTNISGTLDSNSKSAISQTGVEANAGGSFFGINLGASISHSEGTEEIILSQIENSKSKTENISITISNSNSVDLSNTKQENKIETIEYECPSQKTKTTGNQTKKISFILNKIIKKNKITYKQNIKGEIKIKIFDEYNNLIIEDRILINDIMNNLKNNNILPKEIIINTDDISFEGSFLVTKVNNSDYYVKTEEIDTI